jgi:hypothetical protein
LGAFLPEGGAEDGRWAGHAVLTVVDAASGKILKDIAIEAGTDWSMRSGYQPSVLDLLPLPNSTDVAVLVKAGTNIGIFSRLQGRVLLISVPPMSKN